MKKVFLSAFIAAALFANGQVELEKKADANAVEINNDFDFTTVVDLEATDVKNQSRSSTCWSFAGVSFVESEMIRQNNERVDLSEMFVVRMVYLEKARKYIRMHGKTNFSPGGEAPDILWVLKKYGAMPQEAYTGLVGENKTYNHSQLDKVLREYVKTIITSKTIDIDWEKPFNALLDAYLGELPSEFMYNNKTYNARSFADEVVKINPDDYINLTSFTHHPFYEPFILEIPDNWMWAEFYNVPLEQLTSTVKYALDNGYTVGWATDVSERGFSRKNGIAIVPETPWEDMSKEEIIAAFNGPHQELTITQELRQKGFDNYRTQDDHGMHFTGYVTDQTGATYYIVKNSWGDRESPYRNGYIYASESFVAYKTVSLLLHKDALPKKVKKELKL